MTEEETKPQQSLQYSQLKPLMDILLEKVKALPQTDEMVPALQIISMQMSVINAYAEWLTGMKAEMVRLDGLNKSQATMIRNHGIMKQEVKTKRVGSGLL